MPLTIFGVNNVAGGKSQNRASIGGAMYYKGSVDPAPSLFQNTTLLQTNTMPSSLFTFDPSAIQTSFQFGIVKSLQFNIFFNPQFQAGLVAGGPASNVGGGVYIIIPSSSSVFYFAPSIVSNPSIASAVPADVIPASCSISGCIPIVAGDPSQIQFYLQSSLLVSNSGNTTQNPNAYVNFNAYNFDLPPWTSRN